MHRNKSKISGKKTAWALVVSLAAAGLAVGQASEAGQAGQEQPEATQQQGGEQKSERQERQQSGEQTQPDNTGRNASQGLTAEDQGDTAEDRELTRNIRRELVKSNDLSQMAKNIKVITVDGKVTLKGPVSSEEEKAEVTQIAEKLAGKGKVSDQVEAAKR